MRIESKIEFTPIKIVLENEEEVRFMLEYLFPLKEARNLASNIYDELKKRRF